MIKLLSKVGGPIQGLFGLASQFIPSVASTVNAGAQGGNIFNIASGEALVVYIYKRGNTAK